jgi:glycosyltransferase involved in cell wall biosynthesis
VRVLTVIETLGAGGAERALLTMLPALADRGHECEVAMLHGPDTLAADLRAAGIVVHDLRLRHRWDLWRGVRGVARLGRGVDVLHAHNFFPGTYVALSRPFARRPRRVVTFHNLGYDSFPANTPWRRLRKSLDGVLMRRGVDRRIGVSTPVAEHYRHHLRLPEITVVPNGFDVDGLARVRPDAARVPGSGPLIVAVGRLVVEKATVDLVAAVAALPGARLAVVGDGPRRGDVEAAIARHGVGDRVALLGELDHAATIALVAAADVFASASTHEGFPLAPAEAMAVGTPVVVTAVGGVPELVGDGGVLVAPGDPGALADAVRAVLADPAERARLAAAGRARVRAYAIEAVAARLDDVYAAATRREAS